MKFLKELGKNKLFYFHFGFGFTKYIIPLLEIQVVNHCNLNCCGCSHFSNISDEFFIEIESLKRDLKDLSSKFIVKKISLIGGEPLLHKNLKEIINEIKKIFPYVQIIISTNGILIPSLSKDFLSFLRKENVMFELSKYPITSSIFSNILDSIEERELLSGIYIRNSFRKYINIKGNSNIDKNYKNCLMKHCITLLNGNLYHCPFSIYVENFNKRFKQKIKVDEGINIKNSSAKEILKYTKNPIETCRFCTLDRNVSMEWTQNEPKIEDWLAE